MMYIGIRLMSAKNIPFGRPLFLVSLMICVWEGTKRLRKRGRRCLTGTL